MVVALPLINDMILGDFGYKELNRGGVRQAASLSRDNDFAFCYLIRVTKWTCCLLLKYYLPTLIDLQKCKVKISK